MRSLPFLSPVFQDPHFLYENPPTGENHDQWWPVSDVSLRWRVTVVYIAVWVEWEWWSLEQFKRLVYTLHPKAASLRMHSMRKRKVTTKFTMVKKSNKTGGASWYYKIHPTHRRNTTQILYIPLCALHYSTSTYLFILSFFN